MFENERSRAAKWAHAAGRLNMEKGDLKRRIVELEAENAEYIKLTENAIERFDQAVAVSIARLEQIERLTRENEHLRNRVARLERKLPEVVA